MAALLALISEPNKEDKFLDPFTGLGSIPIQRALLSPYKRIFAYDIDNRQVDQLRKKVNKLRLNILVKKLMR